jgi:F-type H+-transporting ATPase subunit a
LNLFLTEEIAKHAAEKATKGAPELPNFITLLYEKFGKVAFIGFLHHWENVVFSWMIVILISLVAYLAYRKRSIMPGRFQNLVEMAVEGLDNFVCGILGPRGRRYTPFLGTLFIYILGMNFLGLLPGMKSPTSNLNTTVSLAICVFFYVQYTGIRSFGLLGYLKHMAGDPQDVVTWFLVPINIPIHIIEELAKPLSLSLRLFGNITGEDVLITVFVGLGVSALSFFHLPIGIPFQLPFIFLAFLTGAIQALVFTLLSTIYFSLMLPHEEH